MSEELNAAIEAVQRMQEFEVEKLPREQVLGSDLNFSKVVEPARKLVGLYRQLSTSALDDIPSKSLAGIKKRASADFNLLEQILEFKATQENPANARDALVSQVANAYNLAFQELHAWISYSVSKTADFQRLDTEARATIQAIKDEVSETISQLRTIRDEANQILDDVRRVAAEQGVSQQSIYFRDESEGHNNSSRKWLLATMVMSSVLGSYAILTLFVYKTPFLKPEDYFQSAQLITSKLLIFAVLSYVVFLSAKNFLSHRHNAVVNKHRQNALMTFTALADAAGTDDGKEVVLTHAASCIFSPQDTGYVKSSSETGSRSIVEMLPKAMVRIDG